MITVDVMDLSGDNQDDVKDDVYKVNLVGGQEVDGEVHIRQGSPLPKFTYS